MSLHILAEDLINRINCEQSEDELEDNDDSDEDEDYETPQIEEPQMETEDDEYDIPLVNFATTSTSSCNPRWRKRKFTSPDSVFLGATPQPPVSAKIDTPYEYFRRFTPGSMFNNIVSNTNLYSTQKCGKPINISNKELEQVIGMYFYMGLVKMNSVQLYWETETFYPPVAGVMSRNRFQEILATLHFVNNLAVTEDDKKDKLWKLRPFLYQMKECCLKLTPTEFVCIDEMMCQFRGKTSKIRIYLKGKPHPWGFKIWACTDPNGFLYDFDVYQGGTGVRTERGQGTDVVLKLTSLPVNANYKVYADNFFTSIPLLKKLKERGMFYTGTVRKNRLAGCPHFEDKELKTKGRGALDYSVEENFQIAAVKWEDNKSVTMLSSLTGAHPVLEAERWDKQNSHMSRFP
ncbi:piggyBac transposable element-derived protein 1-like [Watersipora subatra]|uniref:piggyBac transposable element-derived protein 1-like n=1 Tax=Watersipora subatra TaxID=2589382 RepID=UPI00355B4678